MPARGVFFGSAREGSPIVEVRRIVDGYAEFLQAILDADHPEHTSMLEWSGGAYDPNAFSPEAVVFDDPRKRWQKAFER